MTALDEFLVGLRIVEAGSSFIMAMSLLAIAIHECAGSNGWRKRGKRGG